MLEAVFWIVFPIFLAASPWILSGIGTFIYQPKKKQQLLVREQASAQRGDVLSTLSKPLSGKEVKQTQLVLANVVMSPSWIQILIGAILSLFGGEINVFTKMVDWSRREAKQRLREEVEASDFDEVINMRLETTIMTKTKGGKDKTTAVEILAYGTAIKY